MAYEDTPPSPDRDVRTEESNASEMAPGSTDAAALRQTPNALNPDAPSSNTPSDILAESGSGLQIDLLGNSEFEDAMRGADGIPTHEATGAEVVQTLDARDGTELRLDDLTYMYEAEFVRQGPDLLLIKPDGTAVLIENYFAVETQPDLTGDQGRSLTPDLVDSFLMPMAPGQTAALTGDQVAQAQGESIGSVDTLTGEVFAVRPDGTRVLLEAGDAVFQGDIIETADGGSVKITFIDETLFTLGSDAKLALDEMVYDPASQTGESAFSILKGGFLFVSGQIAETNPNDMTVTTPVATIGIRGTIVTGEVTGLTTEDGETFRFTVVDGEIAVSAGSQTVVLSENFATVSGQPDAGGGGVRMFDFVESAQNVISRNSAQFKALSPSDLQKIEQAIESTLSEEAGTAVDIDLGGIVEDVVQQEQQEQEQESEGEGGPEEGGPTGEEAPVEGEGEGEGEEGGEGEGEEAPVEGEGEEAPVEGEGEEEIVGEEGEEGPPEGEEGPPEGEEGPPEGGEEGNGGGDDDLTDSDFQGLEGDGDGPPEGEAPPGDEEPGEIGDVPGPDGPGGDDPEGPGNETPDGLGGEDPTAPEGSPQGGTSPEGGSPEGGSSGGGGDDGGGAGGFLPTGGGNTGFGGNFTPIEVGGPTTDPDDPFGAPPDDGGSPDSGFTPVDDGPDLIDNLPVDDPIEDTGPISLGSEALDGNTLDRSGASDDFNIDLSDQTGNLTVNTGSGSDSIVTGSGDDTINAGAGDDTIVGGHGGGNDFYDGDDGTDIVTYDSVSGTNTVNLSMNANATDTLSFINDSGGGVIDNDTLTNVDNVRLGDGNDFVRVNAMEINIDGDAGTDTLNLTTLTNGVNFAFSDGAATDGTNTAVYSNFESVAGGSGNDAFTLSSTDQNASGGGGTDTLSLGDISTGQTITAEAGTVSVDTGLQVNNGSSADYFGFEAVAGSSGDDIITANLSSFDIDGGAGEDTLILTAQPCLSVALTLGSGNDVNGIETLDLSSFSNAIGSTVTVNFSAEDILNGTNSGTLQIIGADAAEFNQLVTTSSWSRVGSTDLFTSGGATLILDANSAGGASDGTVTMTSADDNVNLQWNDTNNWESTFISGVAPQDGDAVELELTGSSAEVIYSGVGSLSLSALSGAGSLDIVDGALTIGGDISLSEVMEVGTLGAVTVGGGNLGTLELDGGQLTVDSGTLTAADLNFDFDSGSFSTGGTISGSGTIVATGTVLVDDGQSLDLATTMDLQNAEVQLGTLLPRGDISGQSAASASLSINDGGRLILGENTTYTGSPVSNLRGTVNNGGAVEVASGTFELNSDTPSLTFNDQSTLTVNGVVTNASSLSAFGQTVTTTIDGSGEFQNTGTLQLSSDNVLVSLSNAASSRVEINDGLTALSGGVTNDGTFDVIGTLSNSAAFQNNDLLELDDSATLTGVGTLTNTGTVDGNASGELAGNVINTGLLSGGLILSGLVDSTNGNLRIDETIAVHSGGTLLVGGSTGVTGTTSGELFIGTQGLLDVDAGGTFTLFDSSDSGGFGLRFGSNSTLNLTGDAQIDGTFNGFSDTVTSEITGTGTLINTSNGTVTFDNDSISTTFENDGTTQIENTATLNGPVTNTGRLFLSDSSELIVNGTVSSTGQISIGAADLSGTGAIDNDGTMNFDGQIDVSVDIDSSEGQISIGTGDYLLATGSTITVGTDTELVGEGLLSLSTGGELNLASGETFTHGSTLATGDTVGTGQGLDVSGAIPDVAVLDNGNIVSVWESSSSIAGSIIDPDAGTVVSTFSIDTAQEGTVSSPSVDTMADGTFRVLYGDGSFGSTTTLTTQLYTEAGVTIGTPDSILPEPDGIGDTDIVGLSSNSYAAVVRDDGDEILLHIFNDNGTSQESIGFTHGSGSVTGRLDLTAFDNDDAMLTYVQEFAGGSRAVTVRLLPADGSSPSSIFIDSGNTIGPDAAAAVLSNGNIAAAYTDNGEAFIKVVTTAGTVVTASTAFNTALTATGNIDVTATSDGGFTVVWSANNGTDVDTYAQKFTAAGATDGNFINLNDAGSGGNTTGAAGDQDEAIVAAIDDDKFATVYTSGTDDVSLTVAEFDAPLPTADLTLDNGAVIGGSGTMLNQSTVTLNDAFVGVDASLINDGSLVVGSAGAQVDGTLNNEGNIGVSGDLIAVVGSTLTNAGQIDVAATEKLQIDGSGSNTGTVSIGAGGTLSGLGTLTNAGVIEMAAGVDVSTTKIDSAGGTVDMSNGGFTLSGGQLDLTSGTLLNDSADDTLSVVGGDFLVGTNTEVGESGAIDIGNNGTMTIADGETVSIEPANGSSTSDVEVNQITAGDQTVNDMTKLSNGNYVITWEQTGNDFATIVDADGNRITEILVADGITEPQNPRVTAIGGDRFIVAYYQDIGATEILKYGLYNNDGSVIGGFNEISNTLSRPYTDFDVFSIGADGYGYITNENGSLSFSGAFHGTGTINSTISVPFSGTIVADFRTVELQDGNIAAVYTVSVGGTENLRYQIMTPSNGAVNGAATISASGTGMTGSIDIAALANGETVVVYTDDGNVMAQRYTIGGAHSGSAIQVSDSAANPGNPVVVALNNGGFQVLYDADGTGTDIFSRTFDASGTPTSSESVIASNTTGEQAPVAAAENADGTGVQFAYSSPGTDGTDVFFGPTADTSAVALNLGSGGTLAGSGTLQNTAEITIDGATVDSAVHLDNDGTLTVGSFGVVLDGATDNSGEINATGTVTIGASGDLTNSGTVSIASGEGFVVNGTATNSGEFELGASTALSGSGSIANTGVLSLGDNANVSVGTINSAGGTVDMSDGGFTLSGGLLDISTGEIFADSSDDTLSVTGGALQVGSATVLDDDGTVEIASGGTLSVASGDTFTFESATTTTPTTDVNVSSDTTDRTVTDMVKLSNGNYVITAENSGADIAFIVDANGTLINTFTMTSGSVDDHAPRIAALGNGSFVALYNDFNGVAASAFFKVFNSGGGQTASGSNIGSNTNQFFNNHDVFSIGNDGFGQLNRLGSEQLIRLNMQGTGVDTTAINIGFSGDLIAPVRADEMVNGNVMAVFVQDSLGAQEIHTLVIDPTNTSSIANTTIVSSSAFTGNIDIAALTGGGSVIAYTENSILQVRLIFADGSNNGAPISVAVNAGSLADPVLVPLSDGGFQVLYEGTINGNGQLSDIYSRSFDASGTPTSDEIIIASNVTGIQEAIAAAPNADGTGVSFAYTGPGGSSDDIFFGDSNTTSSGSSTPIDFAAGSTIDGPGTFNNTGNLDLTDGTIGSGVTFDNDGTLTASGTGGRRLFIDTDNFDNAGGTILVQQTADNSTQLRFDGSTFTNDGKIVLDAGTGTARIDDDTEGGTAQLVNTTNGVIEVLGTGNTDSEGGKLLIDTLNQGRMDIGGKLIVEEDLDTRDGTISLSTVAATDRLEINSDGNLIVGADTTFEGGGTIRFDTNSSLSVNAGDNFTYTAADPTIEFNGTDQIWLGSGTFTNEGSLTLGDDLTLSLAGFENNGTVGLGGTLSAGASFANDGKLEVGTTGLVLAGDLNNDNGTIDVTADGTLTLESGGTTSLGGTLDLNGGSEIKASSTNDVLELSGTILSNDDNTTNQISADLVVGTSGVIVIGGSGANDGTLEITGNFTNNGFIQVDPNENVSGVLIVQEDFTNSGTLQVDNAATLDITGTMTNTGTLLGFHANTTETGIIKGTKIINTGIFDLPSNNEGLESTLTFQGIEIDSTAGAITLGTDAEMILDSSTLSLSAASVLDLGTETLAIGGTGAALDLVGSDFTLANTGNFDLNNGANITGDGTFLNQATSTLGGVTIGSTATFENDDSSVTNGVVVVDISETLTVDGTFNNDASATFLVGSAGVLDGSGTINNAADLGAAGVTIAEGLTYNGDATLTTLTAFNVDGTFTGEIDVNSASGANLAGGTASNVEITGGTISGSGLKLSTSTDVTQTGILTFGSATGRVSVVGSDWILGTGAGFTDANGTLTINGGSRLGVDAGHDFAYDSTAMAELQLAAGGNAELFGAGAFTNAGGTLSLDQNLLTVTVGAFSNEATFELNGASIDFTDTAVTNTGEIALDSANQSGTVTIDGVLTNSGTISIDNAFSGNDAYQITTTADGSIVNSGLISIDETGTSGLSHQINLDVVNTGTIAVGVDASFSPDSEKLLDTKDGALEFSNDGTLDVGGTVVLGDDTTISGSGGINFRDGAVLNVVAGESFTLAGASGGGVTVGARNAVNQTTPGAQNAHDATTLSGGNVVVAWEDINLGGMFRIFDSSGSAVTSETEINTSVDVTNIKVTSLTNGGFVILTTHEESQDIGEGVFVDVTVQGFTVYDSAGATVNTPAFTETTSFHFPALVDQDISEMSTGFMVTHIDDNGDLSFDKFTAAGATAGIGSLLSVDADTSAPDLDIAELSNGNIVFTFLNSDGDLHLAAINSSGSEIENTVDDTAPISTATGSGAAIAALASTQFVMTWSDGTNVAARIFSLSGTEAPANLSPIGNEFTVNSTTGSAQTDPDVTVLSDGGFVISWTNGATGDVLGQAYDASGTKIGDEFDASGAFNSFDDPVLTAAGSGFVGINNDNNDLSIFKSTVSTGESVDVTFDSGAEVDFGGGGHLINSSDMTISSVNLLDSTALTNTSSLHLNEGTLDVAGILNNSGTLDVNGAVLDFRNGSAFTNTGTLSLTGENGEASIFYGTLDFTNQGLLVMDDNGGQGADISLGGEGVSATLTNTGTLQVLNTGGADDSRLFSGELINTGTIDLNESLNFVGATSGGLDTRDGRIEILSGESLNINNGTMTVGADTVLDGNGAIAFANGTGLSVATGETFTFNSSAGPSIEVVTGDTLTVSGGGTFTNASGSELGIDGSSGALETSLTIQNVGFINAGTLFARDGGDLNFDTTNFDNANGTILISGDSIDSDLTIFNDMAIGGLIHLDQAFDASIGDGEINTRDNTLTVTGTLLATSSSTLGVEDHELFGDFVNQGVFDIRHELELDDEDGTLDSRDGSIAISSGTKLEIDGTLVLGADSTVSGLGTIDIDGDDSTIGAVLEIAAGETFVHDSGVTVDVTSGDLTGGTFANSGTIKLAGDSTLALDSLSNDGLVHISDGTLEVGSTTELSNSGSTVGTISVEGINSTTALLLSSDFVNDGVLQLTGTDENDGAALLSASGATPTITNTGTLLIDSSSTGGNRVLGVDIINQGTIDLQTDATLSAGETLDVQLGRFILGDDDTLVALGEISVGSLTNFTGDGTILVTSGGAIDIGAGITSTNDAGGDSTVHFGSGGLMTGEGTFANAGTIDATNATVSINSIINTGTIEITDGFAQVGTTDINNAGGLISVNAETTTSTLSFTSSQTLTGELLMTSQSGSDAVVSMANGETLTIEGVLSTGAAENANPSHELFADTVLNGTLAIDGDLDLNGNFDARDGLISIGAGHLLDVEQTITVGTDTTITGTGTMQLDTSPGGVLEIADGETFTIGDFKEATFGTAATVNTSLTGDQGGADFARLANGEFWVSWDEDNNQSTADRLQRFDASGNAIGNQISINSGNDFDAEQTQITALSDGNVVAAYLVNDPQAGAAIHFDYFFGADPSTIGLTDTLAAQDQFASLGLLDLATYGTGGDAGFIAVYRENDDLFRIAYDNNGAITQNSTAIATSIDTAVDAQVAVLSNGSAAVIYADGASSGTVSVEISSLGTTLTNTIDVETNSDDSGHDIAALSNGNFVVGYTRSDATLAQIYDASGNTVGGEITLGTAPLQMELTALSTGGFLVGFASGFGITGQYDNSGTLISTQIFETGSLSAASDVAILDLGGGDFAVAYSDTPSGGDADIKLNLTTSTLPVIDLNGKTVDGGGTLAIAADTTQDVSGVTLAMGGLDNDGTVNSTDSTLHADFGTVSGSGALQLVSDGSSATLNLVSDLTNVAGHTIAFTATDASSSPAGRLEAENGAVLNNAGLLSIGDTSSNFVVTAGIVNTGTISIAQNTSLNGALDTVDGKITGSGVTTVSNGPITVGTDTLLDIDITLGDDLIVAAGETFSHDGNGNQRIRFTNGNLTGTGTFSNDAELDFGSGTIGSTVTFDNNSNLLIDSGDVTIATTNFDNTNGSITLEANASVAGTLTVDTDLSLNGNFNVDISGAGLDQNEAGVQNGLPNAVVTSTNNSTLTFSGLLSSNSNSAEPFGSLNFGLDVVNTGTLDLFNNVNFLSGADLDTRDGTVLVTDHEFLEDRGALSFTGGTMTVGDDTVLSHDPGNGELQNDRGTVSFTSTAALNVVTGETFTVGTDTPDLDFSGGGKIIGGGELQNNASIDLSGALLDDVNTTIDNDGTLSVNLGTITIGTGNIDNTGGLIQLNSSDGEARIELDQNLTNAGEISLSVGTANAVLIDTEGTSSLTNTGTISISGGSSGSGDFGRLAVDIDNTGTIALDGFVRVNNNVNLDTTDGRIEIDNPGDISGERFTIKSGATITVGTDTDIVGSGTLRLGNGAEMAIGSGENYTHTTSSALLEFRHNNGLASDVEISGLGTFTNAGDLELSSEVTLSLARFINTGELGSEDSLINIDGILINDGGDLFISTLSGTGTLNNATGSTWDLASSTIEGGLTVINDGNLVLEDDTLTIDGTGGARLEIGATGTLSASGTVGEVSEPGGTLELNNGATLENSGLLRIDGGSDAFTLTGTGATGTLENSGTIRWDNSSAGLNIGNGARVALKSGTSFAGSAGIIAIANGGALAFDTDFTLSGSNFTLQALNASGALPLLDGEGTLTNTGGLESLSNLEVSVAKFINQTTLDVSGGTISDAFENSASSGTLELGSGSLTLTDTMANAGIFEFGNASIIGGGSLLNTGSMVVTAGNFDTFADISSVAFTNEGVISLISQQDGSNATLSTGDFTNTGTLSFEATASGDVSTFIVSNGSGTVTNDGLISIEGIRDLVVDENTAEIDGNVVAGSTGGTLHVVDYVTESNNFGSLDITGNLTLNEKSHTIIETGSDSIGGILNVGGSLTYDGTFEFRIDQDFVPSSQYNAVQASSFGGSPHRIRLMDDAGSSEFSILNNGRIILPDFDAGTLSINDFTPNSVLGSSGTLNGGSGSEIFVGSNGNDVLTTGSGGGSVLFGRGGSDSFMLSANASLTYLDGGAGDTDILYSFKTNLNHDDAWAINNMEAIDLTNAASGNIQMSADFVFGASEDINSLLNGLGLDSSLTEDALVFEGNSGQALAMTDGNDWTQTGTTVNIDHDGDGGTSSYAIYSASNGANAFVDTDMAVQLTSNV